MEYAAIFTHFEYKARSYCVLTSSNLVFLISRSAMKQTVTIIAFRGTRAQPLIRVRCSVYYWVSCANNRGGFFEFAFVSTHICLALRRLLAFWLTLTR